MVFSSMEQAALTPEERREFEHKILEACKESTDGATDDDVKALLDHEVPTTQSGKCLASCAQEKIGIVCVTFELWKCMNY